MEVGSKLLDVFCSPLGEKETQGMVLSSPTALQTLSPALGNAGKLAAQQLA